MNYTITIVLDGVIRKTESAKSYGEFMKKVRGFEKDGYKLESLDKVNNSTNYKAVVEK